MQGRLVVEAKDPTLSHAKRGHASHKGATFYNQAAWLGSLFILSFLGRNRCLSCWKKSEDSYRLCLVTDDEQHAAPWMMCLPHERTTRRDAVSDSAVRRQREGSEQGSHAVNTRLLWTGSPRDSPL